MQSASYAEIPTRAGECEIIARPRNPQKAFRPGMLEPQEGGFSSGAVFKRSFGVSRL
jgi:hypothetical protein